MAKVELKQPIVQEISEAINGAASVVVVDYRGLTVAQDTELRKKLRAEGITYKVYKNTLVSRAVEGTEFESLREVLEGPSAFAISTEDATAPARVIAEFAKKAPKLDAVRRWCKSSDSEDLEKLEKYTLTNAQVYEYFYETWTPLSVIVPKVSLGEEELRRKVAEKKMVEFSDSASIYMINVTDYLPVGELKPLDLAEREIKELLVNSRKAEFLQKVKRDIYNEALKSGDVVFYNNEQTPE